MAPNENNFHDLGKPYFSKVFFVPSLPYNLQQVTLCYSFANHEYFWCTIIWWWWGGIFSPVRGRCVSCIFLFLSSGGGVWDPQFTFYCYVSNMAKLVKSHVCMCRIIYWYLVYESRWSSNQYTMFDSYIYISNLIKWSYLINYIFLIK